MLNIEESFYSCSRYNNQKEIVLKIIFSLSAVFSFLRLLRYQVPEMNLLQLVPGIYFFFLFFFIIVFLSISEFFLKLPIEFEGKKELGFKTKKKINRFIFLKLIFSFLFFFFFFSINTLIPLSLDSINSFGEKTLENIWSFDEVLNIEFFLILIILAFSIVPIFFNSIWKNEKIFFFFPSNWKALSITSFILCGSLTPTLDVWTQLAFSFSFLFFYIVLLTAIQKGLSLKFLGSTSFH